MLTGEGEGPAFPSYTGQLAGGSHALPAYQGAVQLYILYCIAKLTLSSATPNIIIYVILALATSHPDNMSLKIVVIS